MGKSIAVDRGIGEIRHIAQRHDSFRGDTPMRLCQLCGSRLRNHAHPLGDELQCVLVFEPVLVMQETIIHQPPRFGHGRASSMRTTMKSAIDLTFSRSNTGTGEFSITPLAAMAITVESL